MKIKRAALPRLRRGALLTLLTVALTVGLYHVGRVVTPATSGADVPIYALTVRQTETYRRQAQRWLTQLQTLDAGLLAVLTTSQNNLYTQSHLAQQHEAQALALTQQVSLAYPPPALVSLHAGLQETAEVYLAATYAVNRWIGEPTEAQYLAALESLRLARAAYAVVAANPWVQAAPAPTPFGGVHDYRDGWSE